MTIHGTRLRRAALAALLCLGAAPSALAADEINTSIGLSGAEAPLALHGFDPVAFFTVAAPTPGDPAFATVHEGATYYFASRKHLEAFEADPERYAPAFGGFCAFGVSVGKKFDGNPRYWTVSGGRLYLNLNQEIAGMFQRDVAGTIAKAEKQWREIEHAPVGSL